MQNGKGSKMRISNKRRFDENYISINWGLSAEKPTKLALQAESTADRELKAFKIIVENFNPYDKS